MKKLVSVFLALIMMLTVLTPICSVSASAASYKLLDIPVVRIFGDGEPLYNKDGEMILKHLAEISEEVNLSADKKFNEFYMDYMMFDGE